MRETSSHMENSNTSIQHDEDLNTVRDRRSLPSDVSPDLPRETEAEMPRGGESHSAGKDACSVRSRAASEAARLKGVSCVSGVSGVHPSAV